MLQDKVLEKIYDNPKTRRIPVLFVMECIKIFEQALDEIHEEEPYALLSELFTK